MCGLHTQCCYHLICLSELILIHYDLSVHVNLANAASAQITEINHFQLFNNKFENILKNLPVVSR